MENKEMKAGSVFEQIMAVTPDQYVEPPLAKGTFEVLGYYMNDFEKKAFTIMWNLSAQVKHLRKEFTEGKIGKSNVGKVRAQIRELLDKNEAIKDLMYFYIADRLNMWGTSLGVSKGWKIIIPDEEAEKETVTIAIGVPPELKEVLEMIEKAIKQAGGLHKTSSGAYVHPGTDTIQ